MIETPRHHRQGIVPYVYVDDVDAYLDFLTRAFGFTTLMHRVDPSDPEHVHAEAALGDAMIMIGHAARKWGTVSARRLQGVHAALYVMVDDADQHARRARAAGATIESAPEDKAWGDRQYTARDCEDHLWYFAAPLRTAAVRAPAYDAVAPAEPEGGVDAAIPPPYDAGE